MVNEHGHDPIFYSKTCITEKTLAEWSDLDNFFGENKFSDRAHQT